jgi:hypothetical protein
MAKRAHTGGRAVIIHSIDHARAACEAAAALGVPVTLMSAPGAAAFAGAGWFLKVVARATAEHPGGQVTAVLDCGDEPGRALGALRQGCRWIRFSGPPRAAAKIAAIAEQYGAALDESSGPALDLRGEPDPHTACRAWFRQGGA